MRVAIPSIPGGKHGGKRRGGVMGTLLRMPQYISRRIMPEGHEAEIVFFTGVRHEYLEGHPLWAAARAAREREREARALSQMPASTSASASTARQEKASPRVKTPSR